MDFDNILERRRAINFFDPDRDVPENLLRTVLEDAAKAPSSFNLQPWKVKVLRDPQRKAALRAVAFDQPKVTEAPVVLILLADRDGWKEGNPTLEAHFANNLAPEQRDWFISTTKALYGGSAESSQAFANKNAGLFAMSLMYAASHQGLDTHPMDGFDHEAVRKEFAIPDNYWIPMLIAVGYRKADLELHPKAWRQSVEEMILE
ncbi:MULTISPECIES: nitroreductase family protein [unclassified Pseudodesulfovibrio]|uniref:nitroreductase family protein n=1 Tax=unclassified Pseudodesulfovibrio TaxID=2661612 RepID=UPI000FEB6253|nr:MULTISPECIES: nitroreductase family protein [unclassified Pseudodesulfovibrio]MCJ2163318.1 nitroreductase family protein [Pseudodesulfovibrio sp. S3-i]RWU06559.1 nitroreductase family protein [Pseudodesulfovibrio sp. S3]